MHLDFTSTAEGSKSYKLLPQSTNTHSIFLQEYGGRNLRKLKHNLIKHDKPETKILKDIILCENL